ncbi:MAG: DegT/DnrJ/EryC1/StrS family aminotransferase [Candidatus Sigynarchaeota archaeon]
MGKEKPAILGGEPVFKKKLGIIRPVFDRYADRLGKSIQDVLVSNMVSGVNNYSTRLEEELTKVLEVPQVVSMSSCTAGMILAIQALGLRNSEIILPSFTFSATAHMLYWNNCKPVFADVDADTFNIDIETVRDLITTRTKAILGVHLYGNPVDIAELKAICDEKGIKLLFDGAHALGSRYQGKPVGGLGDASAFSASPTKLLSTIEGGFVSTCDLELAEKLRVLRNYGNYPDYSCDLPGFNARLSEIYAVVGLVQLQDLQTFVNNRNNYVQALKQELKKIPGLSFQLVKRGNVSTYKDFCIIVDPLRFGITRDELALALEKEGIQTKFYFYPPVHQLQAYKGLAKDDDLPNTIHLSKNVLSLPIYNFMDSSEIEGIISAIKIAHQYAPEIKEMIKTR